MATNVGGAAGTAAFSRARRCKGWISGLYNSKLGVEFKIQEVALHIAEDAASAIRRFPFNSLTVFEQELPCLESAVKHCGGWAAGFSTQYFL